MLSGVAGVRAAATRAALGRGTFLGSRTARTAELALVRRACVRARTAELRRRRGASSRGRAVVRSSWETRHVRLYIRDVGLGEQGDGIGGREWSWNGPSFIYPLKRVQYFNIAQRYTQPSLTLCARFVSLIVHTASTQLSAHISRTCRYNICICVSDCLSTVLSIRFMYCLYFGQVVS